MKVVFDDNLKFTLTIACIGIIVFVTIVGFVARIDDNAQRTEIAKAAIAGGLQECLVANRTKTIWKKECQN